MKRDAIIAGIVGAVWMAAFFPMRSQLGELAALTQPQWRLDQALAFVYLISLPGLYPGTIIAAILSMLTGVLSVGWFAEILAVVINAVAYSASWVLVRPGGQDAALRRLGVVTPWLLYAGFVFLQTLGGGGD